MIRFYDSKGEQHPLSKNDVKNFYLQREADGNIRLCFNISPENRFYSQLVEESELEYGDNCYLVKKVKNGKIECDLNFDFLKRTVYKNYSSDSVLLMDLLSAHLPAGWTIVNADVSGIRRTTAFEFCTDYDIVMSSMSTYGVYLEWSIKKKTVKVYLQSEAENTGEYLTDQLNLRNLSMQGDSLSFITRLYGYGKEGLSFASINGGKEYVDNNDYSDKVVCGWWIDERYTVASELLAATREKLKTLSYPVRAYECDVVDLAKLNPKYSFLHFKLHKAVMLLDNEHGIKVQHRIVQYKEYPHEPDRNVVVLSSVPQKISTRIKNLASSLEENKNITNAYQKASVALSELISNSLGVYYTEIKDETGASHYYLHDEPLLENSSTIYTHNAGGYAFTNSGWNNGNPNWQYGFTKNGNAVFNQVCAYGLKVSDPWGDFSAEVSPNAFKVWQDGVLKLDASYNGLNIYDGAITIYKGAGYYSERALYVDSDGNIALDGYLTQIGSSHRALIGSNEQGYGGFYLYNRISPYLRADGTYKPYLEVWTSSNNITYIEGTNELKFGVSTLDDEDEGNYAHLSITPDGADTYGTWNINGAMNFHSKVIVHDNMLEFWYNDGAAEAGFIGTGTWGDKKILLLKSDGVPLYMTYADDSGNDGARIILEGNSGELRGNWTVFDSNNYYRISTTTSGGTLYGDWDFNQNQIFSYGVGADSLIVYNGSSKVFSLYHSSTNNPCLFADNGKDFLLGVSGNTCMTLSYSNSMGKVAIHNYNLGNGTEIVSGSTHCARYCYNSDYSCQAFYYAKALRFYPATNNGGSSWTYTNWNSGWGVLNLIAGSSPGGRLYGTWYGTSSEAISSDERQKNSIEELPEKYSVLFDNLVPIRFKYNDGTSDRYHTGFRAQGVEKAIIDSGLDTSEFAALVKTEDDEYFLRYEEFIALAVKEIQSLKKHSAELERKLNSVLEKMEV